MATLGASGQAVLWEPEERAGLSARELAGFWAQAVEPARGTVLAPESPARVGRAESAARRPARFWELAARPAPRRAPTTDLACPGRAAHPRREARPIRHQGPAGLLASVPTNKRNLSWSTTPIRSTASGNSSHWRGRTNLGKTGKMVRMDRMGRTVRT